MKNIIKLVLVSMFSITLLTGCGCEKEEEFKNNNNNNEDVNVNTNENVIKDQELEVFTFTNTSLIYEDGTSILETIVTNTSNETQYLKEFNINVRDNEGNVIIVLKGFIGDSLEAGATRLITSSYGEDLTGAASIDYEIVR